jgi:predicted small secreted protein
MMMKRFGLVTAACLALALVFTACQNGVQEIEGDIGVGLSKVQLGMPASIVDPAPNTGWLAYMATYNPNLGLPPDLPAYVIFSWNVGPGFNKVDDTFDVFVRIGETNTIVKLTGSGGFGGTYGMSPGITYQLTADDGNATPPDNTPTSSVTTRNESIDTWYARVDIANMNTDLGLPSSASILILEKGIQFGVQTVPTTPATDTRISSGIRWTGLLKAY